MMKLSQVKIAAFGIILLLSASMAWAQAIDVQLWVRYADTDSQMMHFGFDPLATRCMDAVFQEVGAPPPPPTGIFDARLTDPRGFDENCLADGVYRDFRYLDVAMTDTFELDLLPASGTSHSPYVLSWSGGGLSLMQSCLMKDINDNLKADMLATQTVTIPYNSRLLSLFIYALPKPTDVKRESNVIPNEFALNQNYPNPFNPSTTIEFAIKEAVIADIAIFDLLGRKVKTLAQERLTPGYYTTQWNGIDDRGITVGSGVYYVRMIARSDNAVGQSMFSTTRKLLLMK
jgi:hypothetical protein